MTVIRLRPQPATDPRIVLVTITEQDIQTLGSWPLSDDVLAQVLESVARFGPRAIGVDIYRDFQVPPGSERLDGFLRKNGRIIWVSKFGQGKTDGILPPKALRGTCSFNDIVVDPGGVVRRGLLFIDDGVTTATAFALRLALLYLQPEGIVLQPDLGTRNSSGLVQTRCDRLNRMTVPMSVPMLADTSSYWTSKVGGSFPSVTLTELLSGNVAPEVLRNKIVFVGVRAECQGSFLYAFQPWVTGRPTNRWSGYPCTHRQSAHKIRPRNTAPIKTINVKYG